MKNSIVQKTQPRNKSFYVLVTIAVLILGWIITKDISIPSWLTIMGSIFVSLFLLFYGIKKPEDAAELLLQLTKKDGIYQEGF